MGTARADHEELVAAAPEQDGVVTDMPGEHVSVREIIDRDSQRQFGTGRLRLLCAHCDLRSPPNPRSICGNAVIRYETRQ
jgi:hypothetical protein